MGSSASYLGISPHNGHCATGAVWTEVSAPVSMPIIVVSIPIGPISGRCATRAVFWDFFVTESTLSCAGTVDPAGRSSGSLLIHKLLVIRAVTKFGYGGIFRFLVNSLRFETPRFLEKPWSQNQRKSLVFEFICSHFYPLLHCGKIESLKWLQSIVD